MISYAYPFSYSFYGLISVSGFADVKIVSSAGCCKYLQHAYADFTYAKCSYFIDYFLGRDQKHRSQKRTVNDEHLKVFRKFKVR